MNQIKIIIQIITRIKRFAQKISCDDVNHFIFDNIVYCDT